MLISAWSSDVCSSDLISLVQCDGPSKCCQFLLNFGAPLLESFDLRLQRRTVCARSLLRILDFRSLRLEFLVQSRLARVESVDLGLVGGLHCSHGFGEGSRLNHCLFKIGIAHVCTTVTHAHFVCR